MLCGNKMLFFFFFKKKTKLVAVEITPSTCIPVAARSKA